MTLQISPKARISPLAHIEDSIKGTHIIIEANVMVDAFVKIKPAGGMGDVWIQQGVYLNSGVVIYSGNGITIGTDTLIAANCTLAPVNHAFQARDKTIKEQGFLASRGGIWIGKDVWIGANTVILDGAYLEDGVIIGAQSVVRGHLPAYTIWAGNPLKQLGERT